MSLTSRLDLFFRNDLLSDTIFSTGLTDQNLSIVPLADKGNIATSLTNWENSKFIL